MNIRHKTGVCHNIMIHLKQSQMCQTDYKKKPNFCYRHYNRCLKIPAGIFKEILIGERSNIFIIGWRSILYASVMRYFHIWTKRWTLDFSKKHVEILHKW